MIVRHHLVRTKDDGDWREVFGGQCKTPYEALELWATNAEHALQALGTISKDSPAHKSLRAILLGIQEMS